MASPVPNATTAPISGQSFIPPTAAQLYAYSQSHVCLGKNVCHWCASPCDDTRRHENYNITPTKRSKQTALAPNSPFVCIGCWLWSRRSLTVLYLDGKSFQDRQTPALNSWLITDEARAVRHSGADVPALYKKMIHPPKPAFSLSFVTSGYQNQIHTNVVNHTGSGWTASAPITYTLNNVKHQYSVYELEEALRTGKNGKEPGVRILLDLLGPPPSGLVKLVLNKDGAPEEHAQTLRRKV